MIRHLRELTIKRLEHIFDPPGLPLVAKSSPDLYTTSILVRGGPGTGKTTLALALGQAIAADGGGALVYLTTEFSPAEIRFKADLLRLDERGIPLWAWSGSRSKAPQATVGAVFVHHISPPATSEDPDVQAFEASSAGKKQVILEAAWQLLDIGEGQTRPSIAGIPVRAVVIDAFILPDYGGDDAEVRTDLVAFIQALETLGVTPVLVEEVAPDSPSWFPFIVDLVFLLSHQKSAEREWERTLTCPKSRYGLVSAGPHTYSLTDKWTPALFPAIRHAARGIPGVTRPLRFALPIGQEHWHVAAGHHVILNAAESGTFFDILAQTPGAISLQVKFGYPCTISGPQFDWVVDSSEGPSVLAWTILDAVAESGANVVIVYAVSRVMRREWWRLPVEQILDALRAVGLVVVVVDEHAAIKNLTPVADLSFLPLMSPSPTGTIEGQIQLRQPRITKFSPRPFLSGLLWADPTEKRITVGVPGMNPDLRVTRRDELNSTTLAAALQPLGLTPMWLVACAWVAGNPEAMEDLEARIVADPKVHAYLAAPLVRARTRWQGVAAAELCARRILEHTPWAAEIPGLRKRIEAEIRLDRDEPLVRDEGIAWLQAVLQMDILPPLHRAEAHFNLAVGLELRGDLPGAITNLAYATELNPDLYPARRMQERIDPNVPPSRRTL
jgi:KaiC/GvpD/RAD55 family RecA-like ATPase